MTNIVAEFERVTHALALEAQSANLDYQLWRSLMDVAPKYECELNQSRVFWSMTIEAHFNSCLFRLCRVYDHQKSSVNLGWWLAVIDKHQAWFTEAAYRSRRPGSEYGGQPDARQLAEDIAFASEKKNPLVKNLTAFRGNVLAHIGRRHTLRDRETPPGFNITYGDVKTLLDRSMKIINRYSRHYNGAQYSVHMAGIDDFHFILDALRERVEVIRENKKKRTAF